MLRAEDGTPILEDYAVTVRERDSMSQERVGLDVGAGPAGLTAAYLLTKAGKLELRQDGVFSPIYLRRVRSQQP